MARSSVLDRVVESACPIARSLSVLTDPWTILLLREALLGQRTFAQFRDHLGIATDVLSARLATLVENGVLERSRYQEPGQRSRDAYVLTAAGEDLKTVLVALQEWGMRHLPSEKPSAVRVRTRTRQDRVRIALVDDAGSIVPPGDVEFVRIRSSSLSE